MLQQTRVETVVPYYERWMQRFPDVHALAQAPQDDVLKAWEGLGYYSRARNLQRGAQMVRERHAGQVPDTVAELRELPGVGAYTAGAVASIAFNRAEPAVDGNVRRVFCRLLDRDSIAEAELTGIVREAVDPERPGDFNQALMDLGATVCTPRSPRCEECPVSADCAAFRAGTQLERPGRSRKKGLPERHYATAVIVDGSGRVVLRQRASEGLLGGLWEFPAVAIEPGIDPVIAAREVVRQFMGHDAARAHARSSLSRATAASTCVNLITVKHTFSHFRAFYHAVLVRVRRTLTDTFTIEAVHTLALPTAQRKIARALVSALESDAVTKANV